MKSFAMRIRIRQYYAFLALLPLASCFHEEAIPAAVSFAYEVVNQDYSIPVEVTFENKTTGAEHYQWTFEGGDPATSDKYNPGPVRYTASGTYTVHLEAWNGDDRQSKEITLQILGTFSPDFETSVATNSISPVQVTLTNTTIGGTAYHWEFPEGVPTSFTGHDPPVVEYTTPGEHTITLIVENGNEIDSITKTITVLPALAMDFAIEPSFQDEDYEAPLTASLVNTTIGGLTWQWTSTGGDIRQSTAEQTSIHFAQPGTYTVTLTANNGKVTQSINREIIVKPNTGLRTHHDVMLGINTAHSTLGSFYSTFLRRVMYKDDPDSLDQYVDIAFFGLNANFTFNRFVSPDSVQQYTFEALAQAQTTHFINTQETCACGIAFTEAEFDQMVTDVPLRNLNITSRATGLKPFNDSQVPRIVLFRTNDDRKGAIKIKEFHRDGLQSYIVVDIKIQKP
jgi:PKD repeat protein